LRGSRETLEREGGIEVEATLKRLSSGSNNGWGSVKMKGLRMSKGKWRY